LIIVICYSLFLNIFFKNIYFFKVFLYNPFIYFSKPLAPFIDNKRRPLTETEDDGISHKLRVPYSYYYMHESLTWCDYNKFGCLGEDYFEYEDDAFYLSEEDKIEWRWRKKIRKFNIWSKRRFRHLIDKCNFDKCDDIDVTISLFKFFEIGWWCEERSNNRFETYTHELNWTKHGYISPYEWLRLDLEELKRKKLLKKSLKSYTKKELQRYEKRVQKQSERTRKLILKNAKKYSKKIIKKNKIAKSRNRKAKKIAKVFPF